MNRRRLLLWVGMPLLVIATGFLSNRPVPLYDGLGMPDEPYRYLTPPNDAKKTKLPPTSAEVTSKIEGGKNSDTLTAATKEFGPQAFFYVPVQGVEAQNSATKITVKIVPVKLDGTKTKKGKIVGNMYRISAKADNGQTNFPESATKAGYVGMRLPQGYPVGASISYRESSKKPWKELATNRSGTDIYNAWFEGFGEYVLASTGTGDGNLNTTGKDNSVKLLLAMFATVIVLATLLLIIRKRNHAPRTHTKK